MKIIQVSPYFPPHLGGVEYHVKELADGLAKRGHQVTVASSCGRWNNGFVRIPSIDLFMFLFPSSGPTLRRTYIIAMCPAPCLPSCSGIRLLMWSPTITMW